MAVELLDAAGSITQIRLTLREVGVVAEHLDKLLTSSQGPGGQRAEEVTDVGRGRKG